MLLTDEWNGNLIVFIYDEADLPIGFKYRKSTYADGVFDSYIYGKNLQGDIVAIYDNNGTRIVNYVYDAWGKALSTTETESNKIINRQIDL